MYSLECEISTTLYEPIVGVHSSAPWFCRSSSPPAPPSAPHFARSTTRRHRSTPAHPAAPVSLRALRSPKTSHCVVAAISASAESARPRGLGTATTASAPSSTRPPPPPARPLRPLLPLRTTPVHTRWDLEASRPPLQSTSTTHAFFSGPTSKSRGWGHSLGGAEYGDGVLARSCPSSMTPSSNAPNPHALSPKRQAPGDTVVYLSPAYLLSSHLDIQATVAKATELHALHASLLQSGSAAEYNVGAYASCSPPPVATVPPPPRRWASHHLPTTTPHRCSRRRCRAPASTSGSARWWIWRTSSPSSIP
jgi:hypothetical protein